MRRVRRGTARHGCLLAGAIGLLTGDQVCGALEYGMPRVYVATSELRGAEGVGCRDHVSSGSGWGRRGGGIECECERECSECAGPPQCALPSPGTASPAAVRAAGCWSAGCSSPGWSPLSSSSWSLRCCRPPMPSLGCEYIYIYIRSLLSGQPSLNKEPLFHNSETVNVTSMAIKNSLCVKNKKCGQLFSDYWSFLTKCNQTF